MNIKEIDKIIKDTHKNLVDVEASRGTTNDKDEINLTTFDRQRIELGRLTIEYEKNIDTVQNHTNYKDAAYSESLMAKEIQQYESQIPLFEAEAVRQGQADPKTAVANWIQHCKKLYLAYRRLQAMKMWKSLSTTERAKAAAYRHEHNNNPLRDPSLFHECGEGCKYWFKDGMIPDKQAEEYFLVNENEGLIDSIELYNSKRYLDTHKTIISYKDIKEINTETNEVVGRWDLYMEPLPI